MQIGDAPHTGIMGSGNNNIFVNNTLHDLAYETSDTGAWYSGRCVRGAHTLVCAWFAPYKPCRSWVARGNALIGNTFLRIRNTIGFNLGWGEVNAIYLDDQLSQQYVVGNRFIDSDTGVLVNGGRDVVVTGNLFCSRTAALVCDTPTRA